MTDTFEYIEGHILFEIDVDGKPARVIFDTGAGLSIMDKRFCDKHDISVSGEFTVPNAMGDFVTLQFAEGVSLGLGSYEAKPGRLGALDMSPFERYLGRIDGILAADVLLDIPITIDFPEKKFEFGKNIPLDCEKVPLEIVHRYDFACDIFVELLLEGKIPVKVELDTGSYPLMLQEKYLNLLGIREFKEGASIGAVKEQKAKEAYLKEVSFLANKNVTLDKVPVSFEELEIEGLGGNCLLEKHTVCFDLGSKQMYLSK